jgi:hypothetical protein
MSRGHIAGFEPTRIVDQSVDETWKVDPVNVACRLNVMGLGRLTCITDTRWGKRLWDILNPARKSAEGWCGYKPPKERRTGRTSTVSSEKMQGFGRHHRPMFRERTFSQTVQEQIVDYFEVEKKRSLLEAAWLVISRIITSCKGINPMFDKPHNVNLPSLDTIFRILDAFKKGHFTTLDLRHWFYQIPLPGAVQSLFTVLTKSGKTGEKTRGFKLQALPMGFAWSPWIAQGIILASIYETRRLWAEKEGQLDVNADPMDEYEDVITFKRTVEGKVEEVAHIIAWYDNVLIVTGDAKLQGQLNCLLMDTLDALDIVVKGSKLDKQLTSIGEGCDGSKEGIDKAHAEERRLRKSWGFDGWSRTKGEGEYMGIIFKQDEKGVHWRHAPDNVKGWQEKLKYGMVGPAFQVAEVIGVCLWDCSVKGSPFAELGDALTIISGVGKKLVAVSGKHGGRRAWESEISLSEEEHACVMKHLQAVIDAPMRTRKPFRRFEGTPLCFACDSSTPRAAGIQLIRNEDQTVSWEGLYDHMWDPETGELTKSINWKETMTVLETIDEAHARGILRDDALILIAEDNTTAMAAINKMYYPGDPYLCGRLLSMFELLGCKHRMRAVYTNTLIEAADEPSRGKPVDINKCRICLEILEASFLANRKRGRASP